MLQDWWNLVIWEQDQLVHHLACNYNVQVTDGFFVCYHYGPQDSNSF